MGSTLLTAGILLGITFLFVFMFSLAHKRGKKKEMAKRKIKIDEVISTNHLTITEKEELANHFIAIDAGKGKLVYMEFDSTGDKTELIDLQNIKSAKVDVVENNIYEERKGKQVSVGTHISKVQLELTPKDGNQTKHYLAFYQAIVNGMDEMNTLKRRAQHWQEMVANCIKQPQSQPLTSKK